MTSLKSRLAIGTAQFGMRYGIANQTGQVTGPEARAILGRAWEAGVRTLDTASVYGDSEGTVGAAGVDRWRIVTKLAPHPDAVGDLAGWTMRATEESLRRLRTQQLYGLLLHRPGQLLDDDGKRLYDGLQQAKQHGLVQKIGVSIYDPSELEQLERHGPLDLVQAPFNIFDRRLVSSGWMQRMSDTGTEIHVRSVFLQGLLLMHPDQRPKRFSRWPDLWDAYDGWVAETGISRLEACLRFALSFPGISAAVVGVDSLDQLEEIIGAADGPVPNIPDGLQSDAVDLINPSRWVIT